MPTPNSNTLFNCLIILARERGCPIPFDVTAPPNNAQVDAQDGELVKQLAAKLGLVVSSKVVAARTWGFENIPAVAILNNGNSVVVRSYNEINDEVRLFDPLASNNGDLFVSRERFFESWSGRSYEYIDTVKNASGVDEYIAKVVNKSWVRQKLEKHVKSYLGVVSAALFVNVFSLVSPFFLMIVLDKVVAHSAWTTLTVLGGAVTVIVIFESVFDYLKSMILVTTSKHADLDMQTSLYAHFIGLPYYIIKHGQKGVWAKTLLEPERIRSFLTNRVLSTGVDLLFVVIFALALLWMNTTMFFIALIAAFIQLTISAFISPLLRHRINTSIAAESRREGFLAESIATVDMIKALGAERTNYQYWKSVTHGAVENRFKLQTLLAAVKSTTGFIDKFVSVLVVWIGAALVMNGELTVGVLVAAQMLCRRITSPIMQLASLINDFHEIRVSSDIIDTVINQPMEQDAGAGNKLPIKLDAEFELLGVRYRYPGNQVFDVFLDLQIKKHSMVAIVGASGSGKSTITRLLLGLVNPTEGVVRVDGHDLRNLDLEAYRKQIGTVMQDVILFRGNVRENISYGVPNATLGDIVEAAKLAGADEFIQRLPDGYGTFLDESASNISGGQRQRIALARAIVRKPKLLILDEATSALDPESEGVIINNLQLLRKNRTVVIVSHRLSAVVKADEILFMDAGKVLGHGTHGHLLETCSQYRDLWNAQTNHFEIS